MDTRQALLDHASELVRTRGYSGFSYADLAQRVGIRKASIHHHFPAKEDLGVAIVDQYRERFELALARIGDAPGSTVHRLREYARLYRDSLTHGWGCLCGMLGAEIDVIPQPVAAGVSGFMDTNLAWLGQMIARGQAEQEIGSTAAPAALAMVLLSICQGALLVSRSTHDIAGFDRAVDGVFAALFSPP